MKFHIEELNISHNHTSIHESKEVPFSTDVTLKNVDIEIPVEESIETMKAGGADIMKEFLGILREDCRDQKEIRKMEAESRLMAEKNEAERLRQAKASK